MERPSIEEICPRCPELLQEIDDLKEELAEKTVFNNNELVLLHSALTFMIPKTNGRLPFKQRLNELIEKILHALPPGTDQIKIKNEE